MAIFDYNPSAITPFPYWKWNKVLPAVYDDSVSQYEMLCRLLSVVNNIIESTNSTGEQVEALTQLVQQLIDGGFPEGLVEYVNQIVDAAMEDNIAAMQAIIDSMQAAIDEFEESINNQVNTLQYTHEQSRLLNLTHNNNPDGFIRPMETFIDNNNYLFYATLDTQSCWVANNYDEETGESTPMDVRGVVDNGVIKFPGSCSSIVISGLLGVDYNNSRYANGTGIITTSGTNALLTGGENKSYAGSQFFSENTNAAAATKYGSLLGWLHSWQLAEYFYDIGLLHPMTDIRQLQAGDILFYENWTGEAEHWNNINHVEVFLGYTCPSGTPAIKCIQGNSNTVNYASFVSRTFGTTFINTLKWYARIPSSGIPLENVVSAIANNTISAAGFTNVTFDGGMTPIHRNRACSVIMTLDNWEASKNAVHFNVGLYDDITQSTPFNGATANIYLNDAAFQIGPNTFASVCSCGGNYEGHRARIETVGTPVSPITIKDVKIFDGVVSL